MSRVLIVVDMQNDFIDGALGTPEAVAIVPKVRAKIEEYKKNGDQIIFTKDTHYQNYLDTQEGRKLPVTHCVYGTDGWEIPSTVYEGNLVHPQVLFVNKSTFGFKDWPSLFNAYCLADSIESIELCGLCTDICVVSNALLLKANYPEIPISVDASCCAGVTPERHEMALNVMDSCQIDIQQ